MLNPNTQSLRERQLIGRRIRRRRLLLKLTQGALAKALGVSFQLIQKYENGKTRLPEHRLQGLCHHLDLSPEYFSADQVSIAGPDAEALEYFVASPEGIALYRALSALPDATQRTRLVMAVGAFCDSQIKPEDQVGPEDQSEDKQGPALVRWLRQVTMSGERQKQAADGAIRALKIEVAQLLGSTLKARALTQAFAAQVLHTDQGRISALSRGHVEGSSLEKLLRFLLLMGWDAELRLVRRTLDHPGHLEITTRPEP